MAEDGDGTFEPQPDVESSSDDEAIGMGFPSVGEANDTGSPSVEENAEGERTLPVALLAHIIGMFLAQPLGTRLTEYKICTMLRQHSKVQLEKDYIEQYASRYLVRHFLPEAHQDSRIQWSLNLERNTLRTSGLLAYPFYGGHHKDDSERLPKFVISYARNSGANSLSKSTTLRTTSEASLRDSLVHAPISKGESQHPSLRKVIETGDSTVFSNGLEGDNIQPGPAHLKW